MKDDCTILCKRRDRIYKICKLIFGSDGSYYVTAPYHPHNRAHLVTIPWADNSPLEPQFNEAVDAGAFDDDEQRIKLSHHPDGFVQFSGPGLISGRDTSGRIKGIGLESWALDVPLHSIAFTLLIRGIESFHEARDSADGILFDWDDFPARSDADVLMVEAHYLPSWIRYYARNGRNSPEISMMHPAGVFYSLRAVFPPERSPNQNFFGLFAFAFPGGTVLANPFFSLSGPIGNMRRTSRGETVGESLAYLYPRPLSTMAQTLNYAPERNRSMWSSQ
jgi:hypothetical protein